jgi:hypothetical protein
MGNVMIEMSNGKKAVIENVLLVPGMQCNLLSVGKLISKGFKIVIEDETLQLFDSKKRLLRARIEPTRLNSKPFELNAYLQLLITVK